MGSAPRAAELFGDVKSDVELADRFDAFKAALAEAGANPLPVPGPGSIGAQPTEAQIIQKALRQGGVLNKALGAAELESLQNALAQTDIGKEWTLGTGTSGVPIPTGLVAIDLEAPSKKLFPRQTPLRNKIARRQGVGLAHKYKRITGISGSGTGGLSAIRPGIAENQQNQWNGPNGPYWMRGALISYSGDDQSVPYKQFGLSDQLTWAAQFAGQGYEDVRQLSQTSILYASMLSEERMLLGGRGTDAGFSGALAAPSTVALGSVGAPGAGQVGITGLTTNLYAIVTAESVWGESVVSAAANVAISNGQVATLTATLPQGATGMRIYLGTGASQPANTGFFYYGRVPNGAGTVIQGALPTSGANPPTVDSSASSLDYDGILSYCMGANAGYVNRLNGPLSTSNPGNEFNVAFAALYDSVKADPDEILANGNDRKQLSDALKSASNSNYRITLQNDSDAHGATIGAMVTGIQNEVTGKPSVDITVHPWLPQGNMPIISWTLPLPDSQVSEVFAVYNVQDYMSIEWPIMQYTYDISSYWFGTMVAFAPAWCGAVAGITKV